MDSAPHFFNAGRADCQKLQRRAREGRSPFALKSVLSRVMRKIVWRQLKEALLCNGGIAESGLQMPHVHILLVTPLGACDMAQAGADEHQGRVAIGEGTHDPGAPADLAVQAFHDVVRANPRPVFGWENQAAIGIHGGLFHDRVPQLRCETSAGAVRLSRIYLRAIQPSEFDRLPPLLRCLFAEPF